MRCSQRVEKGLASLDVSEGIRAVVGDVEGKAPNDDVNKQGILNHQQQHHHLSPQPLPQLQRYRAGKHHVNAELPQRGSNWYPLSSLGGSFKWDGRLFTRLKSALCSALQCSNK